MSPDRLLAVGVVACMLAAAAFLVVDRGGLLAWIGVVVGALLLLKILRRPSPRDTMLSVAILGTWTIAWGATWNYVVSTWESGEVVQLEVAGEHTARVWVLDMSDGPNMYYDAPPDVANRLLAGAPLSITRNGQVRHGCATTSRVQELPEEQIQDLIDRMEEKYKGRNRATDVFYSVLGVRRDRVGLLIKLTPCG
ncbi:MAG: hypothetical protein HKP27_05830 [Myxococcales bacterium]|nr:hypothetical protein [Myxococcales bacterium]